MTFLSAELTDGIITRIVKESRKVFTKDDLETVIPGLSEFCKNEIMGIFERICG